MFKKIGYILRYLIHVKFNKQVTSNGLVLLQKNVQLIIEVEGDIVFGKNVLIKENTTIYVKKNAKIIFGNNTGTGHHSEISANNLISIGNNVIMGAYVYISDSNHGYKDKNLPIREQGMESGKVVIGDNIWIGRSAMILKNATIGNNVVIGAGSIVTKKFESNIVIAGVPAKTIKDLYE